MGPSTCSTLGRSFVIFSRPQYNSVSSEILCASINCDFGSERADFILKLHASTKANIEKMTEKYRIAGSRGRKQFKHLSDIVVRQSHNIVIAIIIVYDLIIAAGVKKAYRKATLCVHPDKVQQRGATIRQKYICEKVFDLLKNPPSVPTLAAVKLASWLRGLRSTLGRWLLVPFVLQKQCNMNLLKIGESAFNARATFFSRLGNSIYSAMNDAKCISVEEVWEDMNITVFTSKIDAEVFLKSNRPALASSTSWMPDEDFSIVLEAVLMYDRRVAAALGEDDSTDEEQLWIDIKNGKQFVYPRLLFIVTGKGPDRKKYEDQIKRLKLRRVALRTMWLASEDYPLLL
ncbi:hypothetical protein ACJX0J_030841, partial [Zea mays]